MCVFICKSTMMMIMMMIHKIGMNTTTTTTTAKHICHRAQKKDIVKSALVKIVCEPSFGMFIIVSRSKTKTELILAPYSVL